MTSVWESGDAEFLAEAIPFYTPAHTTHYRVLDATWGLGVFWKDGGGGGGRDFSSPYWQILGIDADPGKVGITAVADNRQLPFKAAVFDAIVYDPPHITHDWSDWRSADRYSFATGKGSIAYLFPRFLVEARRVLVPGGIVLAKIADQIHSGRYWWQAMEFMVEAKAAGFTPCDLIVKIRKQGQPQPGGRRQLHASRRHSFWIILREGGRC